MSDLEIRPGMTFFFTGTSDDKDDPIDVTSSGIDPVASLEEAIESATEMTEDHGGANFIFECRVVAKVARGKVRVTKYGTRK